ncbi:hypothetical protein BB561_001338 [Smittium simulii]|uniref:Rhomboid-type serine protease n=1 Tax=Smittium simulii TaxID=133385 RepID=A0A2T9YV15_9FUNG|nr:hypothetical protein BB561_001338 [Smittium simulii]
MKPKNINSTFTCMNTKDTPIICGTGLGILKIQSCIKSNTSRNHLSDVDSELDNRAQTSVCDQTILIDKNAQNNTEFIIKNNTDESITKVTLYHSQTNPQSTETLNPGYQAIKINGVEQSAYVSSTRNNLRPTLPFERNVQNYLQVLQNSSNLLKNCSASVTTNGLYPKKNMKIHTECSTDRILEYCSSNTLTPASTNHHLGYISQNHNQKYYNLNNNSNRPKIYIASELANTYRLNLHKSNHLAQQNNILGFKNTVNSIFCRNKFASLVFFINTVFLVIGCIFTFQSTWTTPTKNIYDLKPYNHFSAETLVRMGAYFGPCMRLSPFVVNQKYLPDNTQPLNPTQDTIVYKHESYHKKYNAEIGNRSSLPSQSYTIAQRCSILSFKPSPLLWSVSHSGGPALFAKSSLLDGIPNSNTNIPFQKLAQFSRFIISVTIPSGLFQYLIVTALLFLMGSMLETRIGFAKTVLIYFFSGFAGLIFAGRYIDSLSVATGSVAAVFGIYTYFLLIELCDILKSKKNLHQYSKINATPMLSKSNTFAHFATQIPPSINPKNSKLGIKVQIKQYSLFILHASLLYILIMLPYSFSQLAYGGCLSSILLFLLLKANNIFTDNNTNLKKIDYSNLASDCGLLHPYTNYGTNRFNIISECAAKNSQRNSRKPESQNNALYSYLIDSESLPEQQNHDSSLFSRDSLVKKNQNYSNFNSSHKNQFWLFIILKLIIAVVLFSLSLLFIYVLYVKFTSKGGYIATPANLKNAHSNLSTGYSVISGKSYNTICSIVNSVNYKIEQYLEFCQ